MWTALISIVSSIGPALLKGFGYVAGIFAIFKAGQIDQEKNDAQATVSESQKAAQNRSNVSGLTDDELNRELQPPHK